MSIAALVYMLHSDLLLQDMMPQDMMPLADVDTVGHSDT